LGNEHLARMVFEESHQLHTTASPTWAGMVLHLGSELRVSPHFSTRQQEQKWKAVWHQPPGRSDIVVNRVFFMNKVAEACSRCLEDWWCQWRTRVDNNCCQLQQYGRLFLHRGHLDTENSYLYRVSMPVQLHQTICMLRGFNMQLGVHCR
jgi:hypothetical protein